MDLFTTLVLIGAALAIFVFLIVMYIIQMPADKEDYHYLLDNNDKEITNHALYFKTGGAMGWEYKDSNKLL